MKVSKHYYNEIVEVIEGAMMCFVPLYSRMAKVPFCFSIYGRIRELYPPLMPVADLSINQDMQSSQRFAMFLLRLNSSNC